MRRQRAYRFVVVLIFILPGKIFSQQQLPRIAQNSPHTLPFSYFSQPKRSTNHFNTLVAAPNFMLAGNTGIWFTTHDITQNCVFTMQHPADLLRLGFFCKKEIQFEKTTSVALRVRLGSLEYVNRMEGKK